MGQISTFTQEQKIVFNRIKENKFLRENFYFTGGTALSEFYLHHRYSEDLDFFSDKKFDNQMIYPFIDELSKDYHFKYDSEAIETVNIFYLHFSGKASVKVDFNYYPAKRLEKSTLKEGIYVDSLLDIAVNKLLTIIQRTDIKDFVDLYFLEPEFGIWDLIEGARVKFAREVEPYILASDFLKIEDFVFLPKMIRSLNLNELKNFFREKAKEVGKKAVEDR